MASCTIFKNYTTPVEDKSLIAIAKIIASDKFKTQVEEIRSLIAQGKTEEAQERKKALLAFTPSATFQGGRLESCIKNYSQFVHLDFDKLTPEQLQNAFQVISSIPYTFLCFISPSGNGLKVFVEVNTGIEQHDEAYRQVLLHYEKSTDLKADSKCKDITRLCFMSHDPNLYKNISNEKFPVDVQQLPEVKQPITEPAEPLQSEYSELFEKQILFTNQKIQFTDGNRNNYIYLLASNCNRVGIPEHISLSLCSGRFDLADKEITASVKSAYTHHLAEFASFANFAKLQTSTDEVKKHQPEEDFLKSTPCVPEELYNLMPEIIRKGALAFTSERERDVFLNGALAILSGCLPRVRGIYSGQDVFPNLFSFTIAPAASGKGALKFAKMLADTYHASVLSASKEEEAEYNLKLADYKSNMFSRKKSEGAPPEPPEKPDFRVVFIPANTSYAKILSHLEQNLGFGIICETEADTMGNVFKQDWGGYSDMLRKAYHHERISSSRKTNNEFIEVNTPCLSVALSGTPGQVTGLIASSEDGLFSRFLFYAFKVDQVWMDVSPAAHKVNLTEHFKSLSNEVYNLVQFLRNEDTEIILTKAQWDRLNATCSAWLNEVTMFTAEEAASIVKRLGLNMFRMAMIFSALRKYESAVVDDSVICTDSDFEIALRLSEIYLHHSLLMFNNLPKQSGEIHFKGGDYKRKFIEALPHEFTRKQAVEIGKQFNLSESTVSHLLPKLVPSHFSQPKPGHYIKI